MNWLTLISILVNVVKTVETVFPDSSGKQKLDTAIHIVSSVVDNVAPMVPQIQAIIATLVSTFHAAGVFTRASSTAQPASSVVPETTLPEATIRVTLPVGPLV